MSSGGPLGVRSMIAAAACDAVGGFSEAAPGAVNAREAAAAAAAAALSTYRQHVPATGDTQREDLKIESRRRGGGGGAKWGKKGKETQLLSKHSRRAANIHMKRRRRRKSYKEDALTLYSPSPSMSECFQCSLVS